jgi:hypothetical protein
MNVVSIDDSWKQPIEVMPLVQAFPDLANIQGRDLIPDFRKFDERNVVLSADHERLFGVFGSRSVVIPHTELVDILTDSYKRLYPNSEGTMNVVSLKDGASVKIEMDLELERPLDIGNGDVSHLKLYAYNSYDKSFSLKVMMGVMRLICMNGAMIGEKIAGLKGSELLDGWSTRSLAAKLNRLIDNSRKVTDVWQSWLDVEVPYVVAERVLSRNFPERFVEPILHPSDFPKNMYSLWNDLTRRATYDTKTDRSKITMDTTISSLFYGNKFIDAIQAWESETVDPRRAMQHAALEMDISDRVTITDDITH